MPEFQHVTLAIAYARKAQQQARRGQDWITPLAMASFHAWTAWVQFWSLMA